MFHTRGGIIYGKINFHKLFCIIVMPPRPIHFIIFLFVLHAFWHTTYIQCALRFNTREITHSFLSRGSINHRFQSHSFARVVIKKKTLTDSGRVERSMEFAAANLIRGSLQRVTKRRQLGGRCEDEKNERNVGKKRQDSTWVPVAPHERP